jgi:hypothetical protein
MSTPPVDDPFTRDELLRDLAAVRKWSEGFWSAFGVDAFFAPIGEHWSPADNVRHVAKVNRPVAAGLGMPRLLVFLRFGIAARPSRRYGEIVAVYHRALADGLRAGRYAARPLGQAERTAEARTRALAALDASLAELHRALGGWSEWSLDRLRMRHPGIGMLTVREMVAWTIYHNTHHVANVVRLREPRRLDEAASLP